MIAHPTEELPGRELAAVVIGPALYLLAHAAIRFRMTGTTGWKRPGGALACLAVAAVGPFAPALVVATLVVAVLVAVILAEHVAEILRRSRGGPTAEERMDAAVARARSRERG